MWKFIAVALLATPLAFTGAGDAQAKVDFNLYLGTPHYDYNVGPGYVFRPGHGWYNPGYDRYNPRNDRPRNVRMTCAQGERYLERRGFNVVQRRDCSAPVYQYRVKNRNGRNVLMNLNARTGNYYRA